MSGRIETALKERWSAPQGLTHSLDYGKEGLAVNATRICKLDGCDRGVYRGGLCHGHHKRRLVHGDSFDRGPISTPLRLCDVTGCDLPHVARGLCRGHWARWRKYGDSFDRSPISPKPIGRKPCAHPGCEKNSRLHGLCEHHDYERRSDLIKPDRKRSIHGSIEERLFPRIEVGDCWVWLGNRERHGYGMVTINNKGRLVHRVLWEHLVGAIPSGLELDHLCRNPSCCNPDHLEPVTHAENVRRGFSGPATRAYHRRRAQGGDQ